MTKMWLELRGQQDGGKKAAVLKEVNPRFYLVQTKDGQILRRNRQSLLKSAEICKLNIEVSPLDVPTYEMPSPEMQSSEMPSVAVSPSPKVQLSEQSSELDSFVPKTDSPILRRSDRVRKPPVRLDL